MEGFQMVVREGQKTKGLEIGISFIFVCAENKTKEQIYEWPIRLMGGWPSLITIATTTIMGRCRYIQSSTLSGRLV